MVEAAAFALYGVDDEGWDSQPEWFREGWRADARAAFQAIEPMIEKLLKDEYNHGWYDGKLDA